MKLLLIGPQPNPITGVNLANKIVLENLPKYSDIKVDIVNTNYKTLKEYIGKFSFKKVIYYIKQYKEFHHENVNYYSLLF